MSYPGGFAESSTWSKWLQNFAMQHFPSENHSYIDRIYGSIGGILLVGGIIISPHARWALSRPPLLWLGKVSFAIYLVHGTFLRTVFAWLLHLGQSTVLIVDHDSAGREFRVDRYPVPSSLQCAMATVVMGVCVAVASHFWNLKLEPIFAKITNNLESFVTGKVDASEPKSNGTTILPLRKD